MAKQQSEAFERYMLSVIEDRREGRFEDFLRAVLRGLSFIFMGIVQLRLWLYEIGMLRYHTLGCQVLSVGNLTVGGTGKTPVVEVFARLLAANGRKVAILSRGYKREKQPLTWKQKLGFSKEDPEPPQVVTDGERLLLGSAKSGDEPYMLARNLKGFGVAVIVGSDRVKSGRYAIKKLGCDTLILDDGFQHLRLKHRLDIVLVDATNPFGNGRVLPRGILREPVRNIKRAGFIFISKSRPEGEPELRRLLRSLNPVAGGKRVIAISGIAVPRGFEAGLTKLGAEVIHHAMFSDHYRYTTQDILDVMNYAVEVGADMIMTTEKDAVRFPLIEQRPMPFVFLRVEIEMLSGAEQFNEWIGRICFEG